MMFGELPTYLTGMGTTPIQPAMNDLTPLAQMLMRSAALNQRGGSGRTAGAKKGVADKLPEVLTGEGLAMQSALTSAQNEQARLIRQFGPDRMEIIKAMPAYQRSQRVIDETFSPGALNMRERNRKRVDDYRNQLESSKAGGHINIQMMNAGKGIGTNSEWSTLMENSGDFQGSFGDYQFEHMMTSPTDAVKKMVEQLNPGAGFTTKGGRTASTLSRAVVGMMYDENGKPTGAHGIINSQKGRHGVDWENNEYQREVLKMGFSPGPSILYGLEQGFLQQLKANGGLNRIEGERTSDGAKLYKSEWKDDKGVMADDVALFDAQGRPNANYRRELQQYIEDEITLQSEGKKIDHEKKLIASEGVTSIRELDENSLLGRGLNNKLGIWSKMVNNVAAFPAEAEVVLDANKDLYFYKNPIMSAIQSAKGIKWEQTGKDPFEDFLKNASDSDFALVEQELKAKGVKVPDGLLKLREQRVNPGDMIKKDNHHLLEYNMLMAHEWNKTVKESAKLNKDEPLIYHKTNIEGGMANMMGQWLKMPEGAEFEVDDGKMYANWINAPVGVDPSTGRKYFKVGEAYSMTEIDQAIEDKQAVDMNNPEAMANAVQDMAYNPLITTQGGTMYVPFGEDGENVKDWVTGNVFPVPKKYSQVHDAEEVKDAVTWKEMDSWAKSNGFKRVSPSGFGGLFADGYYEGDNGQQIEPEELRARIFEAKKLQDGDPQKAELLSARDIVERRTLAGNDTVKVTWSEKTNEGMVTHTEKIKGVDKEAWKQLFGPTPKMKMKDGRLMIGTDNAVISVQGVLKGELYGKALLEAEQNMMNQVSGRAGMGYTDQHKKFLDID